MKPSRFIDIKAVLAGLAFELICFAAMFVVMVLVLGFNHDTLLEDSSLTSDRAATIWKAKIFGVAAPALVYTTTGLIVGRIAPKHERLNAGVVAMAFLVPAIIKTIHPSLFDLVTLIEIPIFHLLGAVLAQRRKLSTAN